MDGDTSLFSLIQSNLLRRYRVPFLDVSRWHVLSLFSSYQNFGLDIFFLYDRGSWSASEPARLLFYESKSIFSEK
jgi:hypothetical protein